MCEGPRLYVRLVIFPPKKRGKQNYSRVAVFFFAKGGGKMRAKTPKIWGYRKVSTLVIVKKVGQRN